MVGVTLKLWDEASRCCNYEDILDAKKAAWKLGIRHYVLNLKKDFKKKVVDYFISDYLAGRTPNPCAVCNEEIKFYALIKKMKELKFDAVATGHYAVIEKKGTQWLLKKGADSAKSQEYFLARVKKEHLQHILFPLGKMKKEAVKKIAAKAGFKAGKKESQEACFLKQGESPYEFIKRSTDTAAFEGGQLVNGSGDKLKDLDSAYYKYTIGQRKGLNYSAGEPVYVTAIDPVSKSVTVGSEKEACRKSFFVSGLNVVYNLKTGKFRALVKIRYRHKPAAALVKLSEGKALVEFKEPQFAVTPGQLAVFYKGRAVIGSGFIID